MTKLTQLLSSVFIMTVILSSCSVEKRVYQSGYHIEWRKNKHNFHGKELVESSSYKVVDSNVENSTVQTFISDTTGSLPSQWTAEANTELASADNSICIPLPQNKFLSSGDFIVLNNRYFAPFEINESDKKQSKKLLNTIRQYAKDDDNTNGLAIASFVCGVAWVLFLWFLPLLTIISSILGIIFGIISLRQIRKSEDSHEQSSQKGGGLAFAGLICGAVGLFLSVLWIALIVLLLL